VTPFLVAPFAGDWPATGFFDHASPAVTGQQLTFRGTSTWGPSGHRGYDWGMPEGTPLFAVAGGTVVTARDLGPTRCRQRVVPSSVMVKLDLGEQADGHRYQAVYAHLSSVAVQEGDRVEPGQLVGHSGNTGCSSGPHLHFTLTRSRAVEGRPVPVDPFGWGGPGPDPYRPGGAALWLPGQAPPVARYAAARELAASVGVRRIAGLDLGAPTAGEWVELAVRPDGAGSSLAGLSLEDLHGARLALPDLALAPGDVVRVWTGAPRAGEAPEARPGWRRVADLSWGRAEPVWDDLADCARLVDGAGAVVSTLPFGTIDPSICAGAIEPVAEEEE
jgi:hypothetical protein